MSEPRFRLIFKGVSQKAGTQKLIMFFKKEFDLTESAIRNLFVHPPRVLWEVPARSDAEMIQSALMKIGCLAEVEAVVSYPSCSFTISEANDRFMRKELSKILRGRTDLALFLVKVEPSSPRTFIPSMMGGVSEKMNVFFRESDTVLSIDDEYMIVLAFSTDKSGVDAVRKKIVRGVKELFGETNVNVSIGYSIFPGNVRSFAELISLAEQDRKRRIHDPEGASVETKPASDAARPLVPSEKGRLSNYLTGASGKVFKRMMNMDSRTLMSGIGKLPPHEQKAFLYRLPFDSAVAGHISEMIGSHTSFQIDEAEEKRMEAILHQIKEEERPRADNKIKQSVAAELNRAENLATLPAVATHVFKIASNPDTSPEEIASVIMNDPSLTTKLLKTVNSAYYGNLRKVHTVKDAVVLLGSDEITDLAFGLAASKVFDALKGRFIDPRRLWRHSLSTALIARNLIHGVSGFEKSRIMTAGLIHDVGKIFLIEHFTESYETLYEEAEMNNLPIPDLEEDIFGHTHAFIGRQLCANWHLPESLADAVAYHHQPMSASENREVAAIVGLADYLAHSAMDSNSSQNRYLNITPILTMGHWIVLKTVFKDLEHASVPKMVGKAEDVVKLGHDLLAMIE